MLRSSVFYDGDAERTIDKIVAFQNENSHDRGGSKLTLAVNAGPSTSTRGNSAAKSTTNWQKHDNHNKTDSTLTSDDLLVQLSALINSKLLDFRREILSSSTTDIADRDRNDGPCKKPRMCAEAVGSSEQTAHDGLRGLQNIVNIEEQQTPDLDEEDAEGFGESVAEFLSSISIR